MTLDFFVVLACCVLGLVAHGARHQPWLAWVLRTIIVICFGGEVVSALGWSANAENNPWGLGVLVGMCAATGLLLFLPFRTALSHVLSVIDSVVSGRVLVAASGKGAGPVEQPPEPLAYEGGEAGRQAHPIRARAAAAFLSERIFVPQSMPHLVALWIYVTSAGFLLGSIEPDSAKMPTLPIPIPVPLDQLLSYNGIGLVLLAFCGVGIFVARKPRESIRRLGLVKPSWIQVGIGLALIFMTFGYDWIWSLFTHGMEGGLASKLSTYNAGTFAAGGGAGPAAILALATGLCAGIGEETLMRGALQPVFGILPTAILHGLLHGQFSHAPIYIVQVAGWSALMGIVRRYTNTTTTIIGHAGFNFITTFMFAFSP